MISEIGYSVPFAVIVALIVTGIVFWIRWRKHKAIRKDKAAFDYVSDGGLQLTGQNEYYESHYVTRKRKAENKNDSFGGKSGSSFR